MPSADSITPERAARIRDVLSKRQPTLTVIFENVHDPHNVSAVIRSCDAVGVQEAHGIYYGRQTFPKLGEKSSASARKWVDVHVHQDVSSCFATLRQRGFKIYTTHMSSDAVSLHDVDLTQPCALVFGNEHEGVSEEARSLADGNFLIPQVGMVQSLNISVACAVSLFEAYRQRMRAGMYESSAHSEAAFEAILSEWMSR
jgi:tRNA (guanosine-2'-O-)-methyltransferase